MKKDINKTNGANDRQRGSEDRKFSDNWQW